MNVVAYKCNSVVNMLVMELVLQQISMLISTTDILLYAKVLHLGVGECCCLQMQLSCEHASDGVGTSTNFYAHIHHRYPVICKSSPLYNVLWECIDLYT